MTYSLRDDPDHGYDELRQEVVDRERTEQIAFEKWYAKANLSDVVNRNSAWKAWAARADL